ncbi:MGMT family protein [Haloactinopolyspora alba]|uniref:MGMT family protein n=1 Tax=Haloactinopolyspora alba TaxID=648780 RepID=UPI000D0CFA60|nr:MGMT family protein [Haloactinopolyspora alba]
MVDEEYVEAVLSLVERIPSGRAMSYGAIADVVGEELDRGGPRQVGAVMSAVGAAVPWWRVVTSNGRLPPGNEVRAQRELAAEVTPMTADGARVDMRRAAWHPDEVSPRRARDRNAPTR